MNNDDFLRYPVGKFSAQESYTKNELSDLINRIEALPGNVEKILRTFTETQLNTAYREGGWTARQVVHHLSDSHMNAYIRFKWSLTENTPTIKAYNEKAWAETAETALDPVISTNLLKALHIKWVTLLKLLTPEDLNRDFLHPETKKHVRLDRLVALYAWHGDHHVGHLQIIAKS
jgi:hypothetical protein